MFARIFIYANFFEKLQFSELGLELLVSNVYVMFGCLGTYQVLQRNLPIFYSNNLKARALFHVFQCLFINIILALVVLVFLFVLSLIMHDAFHIPVSGMLNGVAQQSFLIATLKRRSEGAVVQFAADNLFRALAVVACGVAVAAVTGSAQLVVLAEAGVSFLFSVMLFAGMLGGSSGRLRRVAVLSYGRADIAMWRSAIFMMVTSAAAFLIVTLDRLAAAYALSADNFADYALFSQILVAAQYFQYVIGASSTTAIARKNQLSGRRAAFRLTLKISGGILALALVFGVPALLATEWLTTLVYPQYVQGLHIVPVLLAVGALRASDFWSSFLLTTGQESRLLRNNISVLCAAAVLFLILIWLRDFQPLRLGDVAAFALFLGAASYALAVRSSLQSLESGENGNN